MAQGNSKSIINATPPYNVYRLHGSHIRSGLFDLENLIEGESMKRAKLSADTISDEGKNCQYSHISIGTRVSRKPFEFDSLHYNEVSQLQSCRTFTDIALSPHSYKPDPYCYVCPIRNDPTTLIVNDKQFNKQPLQQLQQRLLHQKRKLLQKHVELESHLAHSQMLHQQSSYKIYQHYKFVPNLHMIRIESGELIRSHGLERTEVCPMLPTYECHQNPQNYLKTSHNNHNSLVSSAYSIPTRCIYSSDAPDPWNSLPSSMEACKLLKSFDDGQMQPSLNQQSSTNLNPNWPTVIKPPSETPIQELVEHMDAI